jgi:hypothetical protein
VTGRTGHAELIGGLFKSRSLQEDPVMLGLMKTIVAARRSRARRRRQSTYCLPFVEALEERALLSANLLTHYDASAITGVSNGARVTQWDDLSGNNNNAVATPGKTAGTFVSQGIGGKPSVAFDWNKDGFISVLNMGTSFGILGDSAWSMTTVFRTTDPNPPGSQIAGLGLGGTPDGLSMLELENPGGFRLEIAGGFGHDVVLNPPGSYAPLINHDLIVTVTHDANPGKPMLGTLHLFINGDAPGQGDLVGTSLGTTGNAATTPLQLADAPIHLGADANPKMSVVGFTGLIAEVLVWDNVLSTSERQQVEGQLAKKYSIGLPPSAPALGDFNGDGKVDLAATNSSDDSVHVQLGNGNGTFAAATSYAAGSTPAAIVAADLNGDGHLDLATANAAGNDISVLLGNGDGTFAAAVHYGVGASPGALAFGDLDGDGHPDLVVANAAGNDISVLFNNGDGTFATEVRYAARAQPNSVALGDFNGDGKIDVAVANLHSVSVLLNHGDGTLAPQVVYGAYNPHALKTADFNGDGHLDLVVANRTQVTVLLGHGDGTFRSQVHSGQGFHPQDLVVGDFNGDGNLDLATANPHSVSVLLGFGDYSFQNPVFYPRSLRPQALAAADLDGDGDLDLVVLDPAGVGVLLNDGNGQFSPV